MNLYTKLGAGDVVLPDEADRSLVTGIRINATGIVVAPLVPGMRAVNFVDAKKACAELDFDGQTWASGDITLIFPVADRTRHSPALDPEYFWWLIDAIQQTDCWRLWSGTPDASDPGVYAWTLYLRTGGSYLSAQNYEGLPLAVRGPVSVPGQ